MTRGQHSTTRPSVWRPLGAASIAGVALTLTGSGLWAGLTATARSPAQQVSSGTLSITLADNGSGFTQPITSIAPGDVVNRYVTLTSGGTLAAQRLTLGLTSSATNTLIGSGAGALRLTVTSCSTSWATTTGVCTGGTTATLLAATPLGSVIATPSVLVPGTIAAGALTRLQISLALPDADETTTNGVAPAGSIQGLSTSLTYTFAQVQRTATTTGS